MRLYSFALSGHAHRVRLFLSLIGVKVDIVDLDLGAGEHKTPEFLALNSFGQVPVLIDHDVVIPDSNAILVYLAKKFDRTDWLPEGPAKAAAVQRWLSVAAGQIAFGPAAARLVTLFGAGSDTDRVIARAHAVLRVIDSELQARDWIALPDSATIADVALYSYTASAPEGNVDLSSYYAIKQWLDRMESLPGFVAFQKSAIGLAEAA
jgi:glutathione S-transferase